MGKVLEKKVALVTGGGRNVGRNTALALADKGSDVVITYQKNADAAAQTVADLRETGVRAVSIQVDQPFQGDFRLDSASNRAVDT